MSSVFPLLVHEESLVNGPMTSKKNKRGDRGSIEEEINVAKRPNKEPNGHEEDSSNMAGKETDAASNAAEPTLYEIRDMLADLQKSVSNILKENAILRDDITHKIVPSVQGERSQRFENIAGKGVESKRVIEDRT